jgi:peptidoglycan/LPS O-acetylase OafA/YrhL
MTTRSRAAPLEHVPELDGVRGLAFLLVFCAHLWPGSPGHPWLNHAVRYGWIGVDLFFVLSGFLITSILWHDRRAPHYYQNFYARRVLRILPAFYLLFLVLWLMNSARGGLMAPYGQHMSLPSVLPYHALFYLLMLANVSAAIYGGLYAPLDVTWSLAVEEHFYLAWPLIVRHLSRRRLVQLCLVIVAFEPFLRYAAARAGLNDEQIYILTPFRLGGLALGALLAIALAERLVDPAWLRRTALWTLVIAGPVALVAAATHAVPLATESHRGTALMYSLVSLLMACVVVLGLFPGPISRAVFGWSALRYVGKISYGCYLFHWLCAVIVNAALRRGGIVISWNFTPVIDGLLYMLLVGAVTIAVATISWHVVERPILSLKRRFSAWGRTGGPVSAAVPMAAVEPGRLETAPPRAGR